MNIEKPKTEDVPDFHGKPNPYVPKSLKPKVSDESGKGLGGEPKVEEIPDFHGKPNPVEKTPQKKKNIKDNQVVEVTNFKEYLDAKGKNKNAVVTINFKDFPKSDAPVDGSGPYVGKPIKSKEALGDMGTIPAWKPKTCPCKDTTEEESLKKTKEGKAAKQLKESIKNMSLVEVTSFVASQNRLLIEDSNEVEDLPRVTAWATGKIMPDPIETIEYITHLASMNSGLMEMLVRNLKKKSGGFDGLVSKVLDQPESMKELVGHLEGEHGPKHAGSLCRAMSDAYNNFRDEHSLEESALSPPIGFDSEDEDEPEPSSDQGEEGNEGEGNEDNGDEFGDEGDENGNEGEDEEPSFPDEEEDKDKPDLGDDEPPPEMPKSKRNRKRFSHDHLIDSMANYPHMRDAMIKHCKKCSGL